MTGDEEHETTYAEVNLWLLTQANLAQLDQLATIISMRRKNLGIQIGHTLKYGDRVSFQGKRGIVKGKFLRQMSKNAQVLADDGVTWRVTPTLLKIEETS